LKQAQIYPAFAAQVHFLLPAFLDLAPADRAVNKPAEMPCLKLPRRASVSRLVRAAPYFPTGSDLFALSTLQGRKKKQLAFRVYRNIPPPLFEALYGFGRSAQELGHLLLRFSQMLTDLGKFLLIHASL
jgi:hypothetical protein